MTVPIRPPDPRVMKALAAYKKQGLNRLADMAGLSQGTGDAVQSFAMGATEPLDVKGALRAARRGIEAWHGSPHKFDKFSLEKIGTGEGAQAYGHGLYFAEAPDVARGYRDAITSKKGGNQLRVGKQDLGEMYTQLEDRASRLPPQVAQQEYERLAALEALMQRGDHLGVEDAANQRQITSQALEWYRKNVAPKFNRDGALYRVRLDVSPDELLDWDKPLSQQSERVQRALGLEPKPPTDADFEALFARARREGVDATSFPEWKDLEKSWDRRAGSLGNPDVTGGDWYKGTGLEAMTRPASADRELSSHLRDKGVAGIRYLDGGSRSAGEGTRNYVIFDPARITILERLAALGIGGEAVRTMLAQAKAAAQPQQSQPPTLPAVTVGR